MLSGEIGFKGEIHPDFSESCFIGLSQGERSCDGVFPLILNVPKRMLLMSEVEHQKYFKSNVIKHTAGVQMTQWKLLQ